MGTQLSEGRHPPPGYTAVASKVLGAAGCLLSMLMDIAAGWMKLVCHTLLVQEDPFLLLCVSMMGRTSLGR